MVVVHHTKKGHHMNTGTIYWKAFPEDKDAGRFHSSVTLLFGDMDTSEENHDAICEAIFMATNMYTGRLWEQIEPQLASYRTHTALSVGDEIRIGVKLYRVEPMGFSEVAVDHSAPNYTDPDTGFISWE
jgi:hypothetical protein